MTEMRPLRRLRSVPDNSHDATDADRRLAVALRQAGRGDDTAFSEFYDLSSALVYGIVLKVLRDPAIAQETTQEIYLELWRLAPRYDPNKGSAKSWTATIAHRRAVDRVRSEQSYRDRNDRDAQEQPVAFDHVAEEIMDRSDRTLVKEALATLSDTQREAVTLAYYGGKTYREVAVLLDIPDGTAKTRIRDGLIKLRDQFGVST